MVKEMVAILFPATKNIDEVVEIIEKHRMKFGLNTGLRLAMFLAQVREETGSELKVIRENLNYSEEALPKLYKAFNDRLADKYGRNEEHKANQEASTHTARSIGNKGYSIISSKDATMRIYEYDPSLSRLHPKMNQWLYPFGGSVQGDTASCMRSPMKLSFTIYFYTHLLAFLDVR